MKPVHLQVLTWLFALMIIGGSAPRLRAQAEEARKEIEKEIDAAGKKLSEKISAVISQKEERIANLEKSLREKDKEIADLKKKIEELSAAKPKATEVPTIPVTPAAKPKGNAFLGVEPGDPTDEARSKLNLREGQGSRIIALVPGAPAEKAGIKAEDIILTFGGKEVSGIKLRDVVLTFSPGDKVDAVILRGAEKLTRTVELVDRVEFLSRSTPVAPPKPAEAPKAQPAPKPEPAVLGILVEETEGGLEVKNVEAGKTGAAAQLKEGDIILALNGKKVKTLEEIGDALKTAKAGEELAIDYKRKDGEFRTKVIAAAEKGEPKFLNVTALKDKPQAGDAGSKAPATLGVQVMDDGGVKVIDVRSGSAAQAAGIKEGDIIADVDGRAVRGIDDLKEILKGRSGGDTVKITVIRGGEKKVMENVKLGEGQKAPSEAKKEEKKAEPPKKARGTLGITAIEADERGLLVSAVTEKGPADKAGLKKDDVILKANGVEVKGFSELQKVLENSSPGDKVRLTVKRGDETKEIEVQLGGSETSLLPSDRPGSPAASPVSLGLALLEETSSPSVSGGEEERTRITVEEVQEGSPAERAGLRRGDEIISLDGLPVKTLDDIGGLLSRRSPGEALKVRVSRGDVPVETDLILGSGTAR